MEYSYQPDSKHLMDKIVTLISAVSDHPSVSEKFEEISIRNDSNGDKLVMFVGASGDVLAAQPSKVVANTFDVVAFLVKIDEMLGGSRHTIGEIIEALNVINVQYNDEQNYLPLNNSSGESPSAKAPTFSVAPTVLVSGLLTNDGDYDDDEKFYESIFNQFFGYNEDDDDDEGDDGDGTYSLVW